MDYHALGINVKDRAPYRGEDRKAIDAIPEREREAIYDQEAYTFWTETAWEIVKDHGYETLQSAGRSEGWLVPLPVILDTDGE